MTTVVGSYEDNVAFSQQRINAMMRQTVDESLDKIKELVQHKIEKFSDSGDLWKSVKRSGPRRISTDVWEGKVYSDLEYTQAIEYGWGPRFVKPKRKLALKFDWVDLSTGKSAFSQGHWIGAFGGHHMFLKSQTEFDKFYAEDIAKNNARIYLHTVDAGISTIVI
jgi:hypothetical protein